MKKTTLFSGAACLGAMTALERSKGRYMRGPDGHGAAVPMEMKSWLNGVEEKLKQHGVDAGVVTELKERVTELEQKGARRGTAEPEVSVGQQFVRAKSADLARLSNGERVSMEVKAAAITSSTAAAAGSAGALIVPNRDQTVALARRRLTIRSLLTVINVTSGTVEYPKQVTGATGAGMVAEGALKPQSDIRYELRNAPIRTIAHWVKASRQVLEDAPQLAGLIDSDLTYGLAIKEEAQLLYGDGLDQNLPGMIPYAVDFAAPIVIPGATEIDTIGLAILQASLTNVEPDGIVLHPSTWWKMRLTKDADGKYLLGDPMQQVSPNLFGLPVVPTQAMNAGEFLVGAFAEQTLYDRSSARVEVGFVNDDFTRNMVTVLGEERVGFAAKRSDALINGVFAG